MVRPFKPKHSRFNSLSVSKNESANFFLCRVYYANVIGVPWTSDFVFISPLLASLSNALQSSMVDCRGVLPLTLTFLGCMNKILLIDQNKLLLRGMPMAALSKDPIVFSNLLN